MLAGLWLRPFGREHRQGSENGTSLAPLQNTYRLVLVLSHSRLSKVNIQEFNKPNSPYFAFLMSTRAGGLGINAQVGISETRNMLLSHIFQFSVSGSPLRQRIL